MTHCVVFNGETKSEVGAELRTCTASPDVWCYSGRANKQAYCACACYCSRTFRAWGAVIHLRRIARAASSRFSSNYKIAPRSHFRAEWLRLTRSLVKVISTKYARRLTGGTFAFVLWRRFFGLRFLKKFRGVCGTESVFCCEWPVTGKSSVFLQDSHRASRGLVHKGDPVGTF